MDLQVNRFHPFVHPKGRTDPGPFWNLLSTTGQKQKKAGVFVQLFILWFFNLKLKIFVYW
jgi:hypothetical protein